MVQNDSIPVLTNITTLLLIILSLTDTQYMCHQAHSCFFVYISIYAAYQQISELLVLCSIGMFFTGWALRVYTHLYFTTYY